jgi:hypothetical protein
VTRASKQLVIWTLGGAVLAALLSVASLYLPPEFGGYVDWDHPRLAFHNVAAILNRLVVFALIGAALAGTWHHSRRTRR